MSGDKHLCKTFINFFQEVVKTLGVSDNFNMSNYSYGDLVDSAIGKYQKHSTVRTISKIITAKSTFYFSGVDKANVEESIGNLISSKAGNFRNILIKCLKVTSDIRSPFLAAIWNQELILK